MADLYLFLADKGMCETEETRVFRQHRDAFTALSEEEFIMKFRLCKDAVREVCEAVAADLQKPQQWRSTTLPVEQRVLMALRFFATGAFLGNIAEEEDFLTSKRPVSESIHVVSSAIIQNLAPRYLKFPATPEEKLILKRQFYEIAGIPGCLGAIDGTMIAIIAPSTKDKRFVEGNYYCHKGYHALNVLGVSDSTRRILYVNARYPGSCHDSSIWSMCELRRQAPELFSDGEWLLGDLGYPLEPWLLTPVRNPTTGGEEAYNEAHRKTRVRVEQCFGVLKMRFRCLQRYRTLHFSPDRTSNIVTACTILHNMCIKHNVPEPSGEEEEGNEGSSADSSDIDIPDVPEEGSLLSRGLYKRNEIIRQYFSSR
ncbi:putative nuclease HARBI1 [Ornithodoros turicata]|uniref:putative nuclease HARBI1 n=1 Tax=Ornithodoros turicata TaxID=34597 RepID=UPI003138F95E